MNNTKNLEQLQAISSMHSLPSWLQSRCYCILPSTCSFQSLMPKFSGPKSQAQTAWEISWLIRIHIKGVISDIIIVITKGGNSSTLIQRLLLFVICCCCCCWVRSNIWPAIRWFEIKDRRLSRVYAWLCESILCKWKTDLWQYSWDCTDKYCNNVNTTMS